LAAYTLTLSIDFDIFAYYIRLVPVTVAVDGVLTTGQSDCVPRSCAI